MTTMISKNDILTRAIAECIAPARLELAQREDGWCIRFEHNPEEGVAFNSLEQAMSFAKGVEFMLANFNCDTGDRRNMPSRPDLIVDGQMIDFKRTAEAFAYPCFTVEHVDPATGKPAQEVWHTAPDFDEEGENGKTIIAAEDHSPLFVTCLAGPRDTALATSAPEMERAIKRLLACPDLNLDNLEAESIEAIKQATTLLAKIEQAGVQ